MDRTQGVGEDVSKYSCGCGCGCGCLIILSAVYFYLQLIFTARV